MSIYICVLDVVKDT